MFQFRLQAWGGRGGSLSAKNTSSTYVSGGKVATVEYYNQNSGSRVEKIRTFADNDGFVKDLEVFAMSYLVPNKYDVVVPLYVSTARSETPFLGSSKEGFALGQKTGRREIAHIGINVNTPKGVSEKQEAYAKKGRNPNDTAKRRAFRPRRRTWADDARKFGRSVQEAACTLCETGIRREIQVIRR